nr:CsiV family protein [Moritella sp. PE36]
MSAADQERWFEVEVILFERNINPAKVTEHWDQSLYPTYSKQNKNPMALFINDDNLITPSGSHGINTLALADESNAVTGGLQPTIIDDSQTLPVFGADRDESLLQGVDTKADIIETTNVVIDGANLKDNVKDPALEIVPASELQLSAQFTALNNHANYNVVLHSAWRMQPKDRNEAVPIRLFAGHNYQQQYQQNGDLITQQIEPVVTQISALDVSAELAGSTRNTTDQLNVIDLDNATTINDGVIVQTSNVQADDAQTITDTMAVPVTPTEPTAPVWKIDGELTIYLEHYLYAKTNLFVRKEGTKTIKAKESITAESQESDQATNVENVDLLELLGIHLEPKAAKHDDVVLSNAEVNVDTAKAQDENSLTDDSGSAVTVEETTMIEPQDKTVPFLNSYPMQQLRVIRSGEIHYLDHPMFGMLIQIRKYEQPITEDTTIDTTMEIAQ